MAKDFAPIAVGDLLEFVGTVKNNLNRAAGVSEELVDYNFAANKIPPPTQMPYLVDVFGKAAPPAPKKPAVPKATGGEEGIGAAPVAAAPEPPREQPYSEILYVDQDGKLRSSSSPYAETLIDNYKLRYESTQATMREAEQVKAEEADSRRRLDSPPIHCSAELAARNSGHELLHKAQGVHPLVFFVRRKSSSREGAKLATCSCIFASFAPSRELFQFHS